MRQPKAWYLYIAALAAGGAVLIALLPWDAIWALQRANVAGILIFVALAVLSQALAVDAAVGGRSATVSVSYLPLLAMAIIFPSPAVACAAGAMAAITELFKGEARRWHTGVFNISQAVLSYGLGAVVFRIVLTALAGPEARGLSAGLAVTFFPFYSLVLVLFVLNMSFVSVAISIREQKPLWGVMHEFSGRGGGNLFYDILASPMALVAAYLYANLQAAGLVAVVLPLLLIRNTYLSNSQLQKANRDLLNVLIKAIETRDPYTSGHSLRVSTLARMIAEDFGLRSNVVARIETAALLHDIGKIDALFAQIISKEGSLTEQERNIIRTHATKGADLLASLTSLEKDIIVGVRHHHERFNGTGYPNGLAGKEIPLPARIIMICDSLDAMLSDRPYRNALPLPEVRAELQRCGGTQFDPDLVRTILERNTLERAELLVDRSGARSPMRAVVG